MKSPSEGLPNLGLVEPINIQMLGGFSISTGEARIEESAKKAPKMWRLLQYLIVFRHRPIHNEELLSVVWPEGDQADSGSAMRNLIFRIRSMLDESGICPGVEALTSRGGNYCWNNSLPCTVDCEEFERLYNLACVADLTKQERLDRLLQVIDVYKGDFLPNAGFDLWAVPLKTYYRAIYFKCVYPVLEMLEEEGRFSDVERLCDKVMLIDQFDEKLHEHHIKSLIGQGKQAAARDEYQRVTTMFFDELGVNPSESMNTLYMNILQADGNDTHNLKELAQNWMNEADFSGAYFCGYGMFKAAYQIESRSIARSGRSVYLISLTIDANSESSKKNTGAMQYLGEIIQDSFRKGDLFTRATRNQYMVMMLNLTYEDCTRLAKRIQRTHKQKYRSIGINVKIQPLLPVTRNP